MFTPPWPAFVTIIGIPSESSTSSLALIALARSAAGGPELHATGRREGSEAAAQHRQSLNRARPKSDPARARRRARSWPPPTSRAVPSRQGLALLAVPLADQRPTGQLGVDPQGRNAIERAQREQEKRALNCTSRARLSPSGCGQPLRLDRDCAQSRRQGQDPGNGCCAIEGRDRHAQRLKVKRPSPRLGPPGGAGRLGSPRCFRPRSPAAAAFVTERGSTDRQAQARQGGERQGMGTQSYGAGTPVLPCLLLSARAFIATDQRTVDENTWGTRLSPRGSITNGDCRGLAQQAKRAPGKGAAGAHGDGDPDGFGG